MRGISVCTTVFNRYELLKRQFRSVREEAARCPSLVTVYVIDRGHEALVVAGCAVELGGLPMIYVNDIDETVRDSQCLAAAWNWFCTNVPEERLIVGEDVEFLPGAFAEVLAKPSASFLGQSVDKTSSPYAAFVIRDACIRDVGYFDERIAPEGLYFEDFDYARRMQAVGIPIGDWTHIGHSHARDGQGTLGAKTPAQLAEHHRKFLAARNNYSAKWGDTRNPFE